MSRTLALDFVAEKDKSFTRPFPSLKVKFGGAVGDLYFSGHEFTLGGLFHYGIVKEWGEIGSLSQARDGMFSTQSLRVSIINYPLVGSPAKRFSDLWAGLGAEGVEVDVYQNFLKTDAPGTILQTLAFAGVLRPKSYTPDTCEIEIAPISEKYLPVEISEPIDQVEFPRAAPDEIGKRLQLVYGAVQKVRGQAIVAGPWGRLRSAWSSGDVPIYFDFYESIFAGDVIRIGGVTSMTVTAKRKTTVTAVTKANLVSSTDATSYATGSHTPAANKLQILSVTNSKASAPDIPTASGNSLTWIQLATVTYSSDTRRLTVFGAIGAAPTTGTTTVNFSGAIQTACVAEISEFTGIDGDAVANIIAQTATATVTAATSILSDMLASSDASHFYEAISRDQNILAPSLDGFTQLFANGAITPPLDFNTQHGPVPYSKSEVSFGVNAASGIAIKLNSSASVSVTSLGSDFNAANASIYGVTCTPPANQLILMVVCNTRATDPTLPDPNLIPSQNLTWELIATTVNGTMRLSLFGAINAAPVAGDSRANYNGTVQLNNCMQVLAVAGITGATVSEIVSAVEFVSLGSVAGLSLDVGSFTAAENVIFSCCGVVQVGGAPITAVTPTPGWTEHVDSGVESVRLQTQSRIGRSGGVSFTAVNAAMIKLELRSQLLPRLIVSGTPASHPVDASIQPLLPSYSYLFNSLPSKAMGTIWVRNGGALIIPNAATYTVSAADSALVPGRTVARVTFTKPPEHYGESIKEQAGIGVSVAWDGTSFTGTTSADFPASYAQIGNYNFSVPWSLSYTNVSSITAKINGVAVFAMSSGSITTNTNPYTYSSTSKTISVSLTIIFGAGGGTANFVLGTVSVNYLRDTFLTEAVTGSYADSAHALIGDEVFADVDGCFDDGSGTYTGTASALIERCADVMHHLARVPGGVPAERVDAPSFVQARNDAPSYFKFAGVVTDRASGLKELLLALGMQGRVKVDWPVDKLTARFLKDAYGAPAKTLTRGHIRAVKGANGLKPTIRNSRAPAEDLFNVVNIYFARRQWGGSRSLDDFTQIARTNKSVDPAAASIAKYGLREDEDRFWFDFIAAGNNSMANACRDFYLAQLSEPARLVELDAFLDQFELLPGDVIALNYLEPDGGYFDGLDGDNKFLVEELRVALNSQAPVVRLKMREVA